MLKQIENEATYPHDEDEGICSHGMSAWLCAHPIYHYPTDEMMNGGQFY